MGVAGRRRRVTWLAVLAVLGIGAAFSAGAGAATQRLAFDPPTLLAGAAGGTEPQLAVGPDGTRYDITGANTTNSSSVSAALVYRSAPGSTRWGPTVGQLGGTRVVGPDVDVVVTSAGSVVALEEDSAALSLVVNHSSDGGRTWTQSTGLQQLLDQDRPWLAAGPGNTVYLLFHNGFSSNATHNMFLETSTDGGATFGAPVPITTPGSGAWADLQCADSGGPSALLVNPHSHRLYAVWASRHGALGGCGLQPLTPFTLVPEDRIWVATSPTGALGTWTTSIAVDNSATGQVVGMNISPAALDRDGNVWVGWSTPPRGFPDDTGAGFSVRRADPLLHSWSTPVVVVRPSQPGHILDELVAGDAGRLAVFYLASTGSGEPRWYPYVSVVTGALGPHPVIASARLAALADYQGTATALMGTCDTSSAPVATVTNNPVTCGRSADVVGIVLDTQCRVVVTWPSLAPASSATLGVSRDATWVTTQRDGPRLCA
jgi:hypothetical protein